MQPDVVLGALDMLGAGGPARTLVVGCEPASVDYGMELSEPVAGAVGEAVQVILGLVADAGRASQVAARASQVAARASQGAGQPGAASPGTPAADDTQFP